MLHSVLHQISRPLLSSLILLCLSWRSAAEEPKPSSASENAPAVKDANKALDEPTKLNFDEVPLGDVIAYLKKLHSIDIAYDVKALDAIGVNDDTKLHLHVHRVTLRSALRLMLRQLDPKMSYAVQNGRLTLTSTAVAPIPPAGPPTAKTAKVKKALDEPTKLDFEEMPLDDITDYLRDLHGINIVVDYKSLAANGVNSDAPVTINVKGITLRAALTQVLQKASPKLTFSVQDEVLLITTKDAAGKH